MKLILYIWGSNSDSILKSSLIKLGYDIVIYDSKCEHYTKDLLFAQGFINLIHEVDADGVISFDYFPIISMVCNTVGIVYYSWVYDSPHYTLYAKTSMYKCNRIGCFDRAMVERLNGLGIDTVFHLPLGVDWGRNDDAGTENLADTVSDRRYKDNKYICDVSFVGSLYTGEYNYYDSMCRDSVLRSKADDIIDSQCFEYRVDHICNFFDEVCGNETREDIIDRVRALIDKENLFPGSEYIEDIEYIFNSFFLEKKVTVEERRRLLNRVADLKCDFRLYTASDLKNMPRLKNVCKGAVDYHKKMPFVFRNSRINLNITLRSIKSGIPLRALDIMGCGGFLLSNYQEELAEYFEEGKEVVMFYDLEDCIEKINYYLENEDERKKIADAGYKAVCERFDLGHQLALLLHE